MNLLTLDIGNTNIKAGIFSNKQLEKHLIIPDIKILKSLISDYDITDIAICSVNPLLTERIKSELSHFLDHEPYIINRFNKFNLEIHYKTPETLGMDRICSLEGGLNFIGTKLIEGQYLVTIDLGTATTINILKFPNIFIGGLIAPGIQTMFNSLNKQTAQLPVLSPKDYKTLIGENTNTSLASGVINSAVSLIDKVFNHLKNFSDCKRIIAYATGGMAKSILEYLPKNIFYDEFLVLKGIRVIYNLNKNK